ncbi:MAG: GxxExxY protein [Verrucomicrobiales bacterium]
MKLDTQELPHIIVSACLEVHKEVGPHLMREAYLDCVAHELSMRELVFVRDVPVSINYKNRKVPSAFRIDFIVEGLIAVDVQTYPERDAATQKRHKDRVGALLRLSGYEIGLLINFHAVHLRNGLKRLIVSNDAPSVHYR